MLGRCHKDILRLFISTIGNLIIDVFLRQLTMKRCYSIICKFDYINVNRWNTTIIWMIKSTHPVKSHMVIVRERIVRWNPFHLIVTCNLVLVALGGVGI